MIKNLYLYILCLSKIFNKRVWRDHPAPVPVLRQYCRQVICQTSTITAMNEEKQPVANPPPTAPPTAYTPGRTHSPPQYVNPPQGAPQQQRKVIVVVTAVPVRPPEVWVSPRGAVSQPDLDRIVISGTARYQNGQLTSTSYTYADELPCLTRAMLVCIVLCFFVGSPISLMCSIPAYYFINKVCSVCMCAI